MNAIEELLPNVIQSFEFDDEDLPTLEPYEFDFSEELSQPYLLHLSLVAKDPSVDESKLVGHACTLTLTRGGLVRNINGLVRKAVFSGIAVDAFTPLGGLPTGLLHLTIVPGLWMLGQRKNNRIFQDLKVTDILKKVLEEALGDYGRKVTMKTSKDYQELEYCTQYNETDLEFVQRLMASEGIMSYFKQGEKAEELVLFDDSDTYPELVTMDHGKVPFETGVVESQLLETVRQFRVDTRQMQTTVSVRNFNWSKGGAPDDSATQEKDSLEREREWYLGEAPVGLRALGGDGVYAKTSAQNQAKLMQETARSRIHLAHGGGNVTGLTPGVVFELDNALRVEINRKYLVTKANHLGRRPGDTKKGTFAGDVSEVMYSNTFDCVASDVLFRLPSPPRRFIQTMQTAVVVGDEDITTDVHGRIKVQFHWDRQGKNDIKSSCWVRVAQPSAGIGFGHVFIPRRGQEVVITFLEGDPDKPLVIGSVFNGINRPPYDLPAEKTRSVIRTRSTPDSDGYNEISFEDNKDLEQLYIQAQKDMKELVKHDHEVLIKNDERLTVEKNQSESIGVDQSLSVGGNRTHHVTKDESITIDGNQSITIKGGGKSPVHSTVNVTGKHTLDASDTIKIQAPTSITLECGGSTFVMVPGKITLTAGGGATIVLDANALTQASGGGKIFIDANVKSDANGGGNLLLDENVLAKSSQGSTLLLDTHAAMEGVAKATVTGTDEATVSASGSTVKTSPTGVESSGPKVDVTGAAVVTIGAPMVKIN